MFAVIFALFACAPEPATEPCAAPENAWECLTGDSLHGMSRAVRALAEHPAAVDGDAREALRPLVRREVGSEALQRDVVRLAWSVEDLLLLDDAVRTEAAPPDAAARCEGTPRAGRTARAVACDAYDLLVATCARQAADRRPIDAVCGEYPAAVAAIGAARGGRG